MYSEDRAMGVKIWQQHGPWAAGSHAATLYFQYTLPDVRDWAAGNLYMPKTAVPRVEQE